MNILIVDNDALTIQVLQRYVGERLGHQTVGVRTGTEAMALLDCQDFDLVLLDLDLPDGGAFTVLKQVRALLKEMDMPVLVMGEGGANHQLKAFDQGANDFVAKPLDMRLVAARVHILLMCRQQYLHWKRGESNGAIGEGLGDRTTTVSTLSASTVKQGGTGGSRPIPCEVPVMVYLEGGSFFCKTLKIGKSQLSVLAFNEIPRSSTFRVQIVHPTGETMELTVVENRRSEVMQGAAGSLSIFFDVSKSTPLYERFCEHLDRAWRHKGLSGLKEVLRGSMSISRAEGVKPQIQKQLKSIDGARYRYQKLLGVGGFATVFLVRDLALQRDVAMKVLSPELAADLQAREKFLGEARIAAQFHHANIVFVYEVGECQLDDLSRFLDFPPDMVRPYHEHFIYFTMQYIEGQSLAEVLREQQGLTPGFTLHVFSEVLRALAFAHLKGVIHRDIKPGNIMIDRDNHIIVTDFGIARMIEENLEQGGGSGVECTPRYASPEQLLSRSLDGRSDLYSLGITIYEMLCGAPPFEDVRLDILVARQLNEEPPHLLERVPGLNSRFAEVVMRCIAKAPDSRYGQIPDVLDDLDALAQTERQKNRGQATDTLTLLLDRVLLLNEREEAEEVMEKLVAHLHVHHDDGRHARARMTRRIAEPAVLDALLTHALDEAFFPLLYRFFGELKSSKAVRTLLRWFIKEKEPRTRRFLSRLAVLSSGDNHRPLIHGMLDMQDDDASLILRAMREMGKSEDQQKLVTHLARHTGERTRLELLHYIRALQNPSEEVQQVVVSFARTSNHPTVRDFAAKLSKA